MDARHLLARLARRARAYLERFEAPLRAAEAPAEPAPPDPLQVAMQLEALSTGWFNARTGELVPGFPIGPDDVVLDFGCGDTPMVTSAAVAAGEVILADIDAEKLEAGGARVAAHQSSKLRPVLVKDDSLPLPDACVTRVVATEVLEHVEDPARVMRELVRVARPWALFVISVPAPASENLQRPFVAPGYFDPPNHIRVFEPEALHALVRDAGLEIVRSEAYGLYWTLWWCFFWTCGCDLAAPNHPLLESWTRTWGLLLQNRSGPDVKAALDRTLPKSHLVVARKP